MSEPPEPNDAVEPVTLDELVALMAGELTEAEEARLRMRMARDPHADTLLQQLQGVDALFDRPDRPANEPEIPPELDARLRAFVADLVRRRAEGELGDCLLYTFSSPRDLSTSRMPSSA